MHNELGFQVHTRTQHLWFKASSWDQVRVFPLSIYMRVQQLEQQGAATSVQRSSWTLETAQPRGPTQTLLE